MAARVGADAGAKALGAVTGFHAGRTKSLLAEARAEVRDFARARRFWS